MNLKAIDLFSGCGGLSLGLEKAGFKVVYANDIHEDAMKTYKYNFPKTTTETKDITRTNPNDVKRKIGRKKIGIIVAGTPCQGFSTSGKRNLNDPRNKLFKQLLKFLIEFQPKIFVMENVTGLLTVDNGKTFKKIKKSFSNLGYFVYHRVLSATDFGVPQYRNRIFIIGSRKNIPENKLFPRIKKKKTVSTKSAISDLEFLGYNEKSNVYRMRPKNEYQKTMRKGCKVLCNHESPNHSASIQKRFFSIPQGVDGRDVLKKLGTNKRDYYKLHPRKPCRTVTTLPEDLIHYKKNRIPTVRELARLQSFPDKFVFLGPRTTGGPQRKFTCCQYTQVGNAVPPLMAEAVFKNLVKVLVSI